MQGVLRPSHERKERGGIGMLEKEITFDRVVRWLIAALIAVGLVLLINRLSKVLLPFFIAWIMA